MRLTTAWTMAILPGLLLLASAAPASAQFAPTPYTDGQNGYAPGYNSASPQDGPVTQATPPAIHGGTYGGEQPLQGGEVAYGDSAYCEDEAGGLGGTVLFNGDPFGEPSGNQWVLPYFGRGRVYGTGGICNPRWYDASVEFLYLTREDVSRRMDFMALRAVDPNTGVLSAPIPVLSTENLGFRDQSGFRATIAYMIDPGTNIEASYFGTYHWQSAARFNARNSLDADGDVNGRLDHPFSNRLYSAFSRFGENGPTNNLIARGPVANFPAGFDVIHQGGQAVDLQVDPTPAAADIDPRLPQQGFTDTDFATQSSIIYSSQFNSAELSARRRYLSPNGRIHTSTMAGVRYTNLSERFRWTISNVADQAGAFAYDVRTSNNLIGFQAGQEIQAAVSKTFRFGGEAKAGIYGNVVEQHTVIDSSFPRLIENAVGSDVAFIGEGNLYMIAYLNSQVSLKGGYTFVYVDGVALAPEQVSFKNPFAFNAQGARIARPRFLNDNGDVFLHGFHAGVEVNW